MKEVRRLIDWRRSCFGVELRKDEEAEAKFASVCLCVYVCLFIGVLCKSQIFFLLLFALFGLSIVDLY